MKILLFNLGTIEDRIIEWDIKGFHTLFEQDIILWGPIPDGKFIFKDKEIPILRIFEETTISDVFRRLPEKWYPDVITCDTSVINYVPDIYKSPVKTILFTRDSWSDTIFNKKLVEFFDFVNHATIDRSIYSSLNVNLLPLSNFAVSIPSNEVNYSDFKTRDIDVIAIANYSMSFYHDRFKTLYKLSASNNSGINIKFFKGIKRSEIYSYYQNSKIVIDWANTLSNRSYEAALNGCLLFSHKDNVLIRDFWTPWEEYIPYDDNNVFELVEYYIKNPEQSLKVISNAKKKIERVPASWGEFVWENINIAINTDVSIQERIRRNESTPVSVLHYRAATPLLFNYDYHTNFPSDWKEIYFERINSSISSTDILDNKIPPLIEALHMSFLLKRYEFTQKYLNELKQALPQYAWIYYFEARICFEHNDNNQSITLLQKSIDLGIKFPELLQQYVLPVIEKGNTCDQRRIINYMWESVYQHNNEYQVNALLYFACELKGDYYLRGGDKNSAISAYSEAVNYLPIPDCIYKLNTLLVEKKDFEKVLQITEKGIDDSPYDSIQILYRAHSLIKLKQKPIALAILKEHRKALNSFAGVRKLEKLQNLISILIPLSFLSSTLVSKILLELIRILKEKLTLEYTK
jgi:tetratricopeptide (TPR) repeat protein